MIRFIELNHVIAGMVTCKGLPAPSRAHAIVGAEAW
jgi:hypothetical protein